MPRTVEVVLYDIAGAIQGIEQAIAGKSFQDFQDEWILRHGVQRGLEIISEASRRLPLEMRDEQPDVPWRKILGIGNVLRHEYYSIADDVIWEVATRWLPKLKVVIAELRTSSRE